MNDKEQREKLYKEHLDEIFGIKSVDDFTQEDVDRCLERLIRCIPNDGKLYKYRSVEDTQFSYAFDALSKGYLWMASADTLNDDLEATLQYDPEKSVKELRDYVYSHPVEFVKFIFELSNTNIGYDYNDYQAYEIVMQCIDRESGEINVDIAAGTLVEKCHIAFEKAVDYINQVNLFVSDMLARNEHLAKTFAESHLRLNENMRKMSYIYSMSELFDLDNMWSLYANNNKGFCIEYDYHKVKNLDFETQRRLINTVRVIYSAKSDYSFVPTVKIAFNKHIDDDESLQANRTTLLQLITKSKSWEAEIEWRIFLCNLDNDNKLFADIVSAIIIDERVVKTENAQKLIDLCKQKGWSIKIRKKNSVGTKHEYVELKD